MVGDILQCYYRPWMGKDTCKNCIVIDCTVTETGECPGWNNYLGTARVTEVYPLAEVLVDEDSAEVWAMEEGFKSFEEADTWFQKHSKYGKEWVTAPYIVIRFLPDWLNYCKDCKYWNRLDNECGHCSKDTSSVMLEYEFCDEWERSDE